MRSYILFRDNVAKYNKAASFLKEKEIMRITLKDGSVKEYAGAMSVIDIANDIS